MQLTKLSKILISIITSVIIATLFQPFTDNQMTMTLAIATTIPITMVAAYHLLQHYTTLINVTIVFSTVGAWTVHIIQAKVINVLTASLLMSAGFITIGIILIYLVLVLENFIAILNKCRKWLVSDDIAIKIKHLFLKEGD